MGTAKIWSMLCERMICLLLVAYLSRNAQVCFKSNGNVYATPAVQHIIFTERSHSAPEKT